MLHMICTTCYKFGSKVNKSNQSPENMKIAMNLLLIYIMEAEQGSHQVHLREPTPILFC
jgi:hypothetical protein